MPFPRFSSIPRGMTPPAPKETALDKAKAKYQAADIEDPFSDFKKYTSQNQKMSAEEAAKIKEKQTPSVSDTMKEDERNQELSAATFDPKNPNAYNPDTGKGYTPPAGIPGLLNQETSTGTMNAAKVMSYLRQKNAKDIQVTPHPNYDAEQKLKENEFSLQKLNARRTALKEEHDKLLLNEPSIAMIDKSGWFSKPNDTGVAEKNASIQRRKEIANQIGDIDKQIQSIGQPVTPVTKTVPQTPPADPTAQYPKSLLDDAGNETGKPIPEGKILYDSFKPVARWIGGKWNPIGQ